jgi:hypothetical protein
MKGFNKENVIRFGERFEEFETRSHNHACWHSAESWLYNQQIDNSWEYRHKANQTPQQFKESDFIFEEDKPMDTTIHEKHHKPMIDLSKNQTFDEPVECWTGTGIKVELYAIDYHRDEPLSTSKGSYGGDLYLTDPNKPEVKKHSHDELIIGASRKGWVFQNKNNDEIMTDWTNKYKINRFRVAYSYNGADTEWFSMEAKDDND